MISQPATLLGVEGGGTKTVAWVAKTSTGQELEIIGRGLSGPSNLHAVGLNQTLANVLEAVQQAEAESGINRQKVDAACLTMAGVDRATEAELLTQWAITQHIGRRVKVANDSVGLLAAGTKQGWGIALVSGTGSIAFGQTPEGETTRTGGWGYLMGDEGSAYMLTLAGLRSAVRSADGREPFTRLLPDFLERLEVRQAEDLLEQLYLSNHDRAWIASLADVVTSAADAGDLAALRLLEVAATELAHLVVTTARKLKLQGRPIPVCYTGGLLLNTPNLQDLLLNNLSNRGIVLDDYVAVVEPVCGAIKIAQQLLTEPTA